MHFNIYFAIGFLLVAVSSIVFLTDYVIRHRFDDDDAEIGMLRGLSAEEIAESPSLALQLFESPGEVVALLDSGESILVSKIIVRDGSEVIAVDPRGRENHGVLRVWSE